MHPKLSVTVMVRLVPAPFAVVGVPLVAGYTFFVYRTFYGKVKMDEHSY